MDLVKKLLFANLFLISLGYLLILAPNLLLNYDTWFSLDINIVYQLLIFNSILLLTSVLFNIFVTLTLDWKKVLPVIALATLLPLVLTPAPLSYILCGGIFISLLLNYLPLRNRINTYINFSATQLLTPSIKGTVLVLILSFAFAYYLSTSRIIAKDGFKIPDSLIETVINSLPREDSRQSQNREIEESPEIPPEQIELLRQNPALLEQAGITPEMLEEMTRPNNTSKKITAQSLETAIIKQAVRAQIDSFVQPHLNLLPIILALLLFSSLTTFQWILGFLITPLLFAIFWIFEKTGFIHFEKEMREVKKLVV